MRARLWLLVMWAFPVFSRPWLWCLRRASDATDWGEALDVHENERPF